MYAPVSIYTCVTIYLHIFILLHLYNCICTYVYYLITAWGRVLLEKPTSFQLVKEMGGFYGNRRFITAFTSARHLSLS